MGARWEREVGKGREGKGGGKGVRYSELSHVGELFLKLDFPSVHIF